jgi:hypothetical protein
MEVGSYRPDGFCNYAILVLQVATGKAEVEKTQYNSRVLGEEFTTPTNKSRVRSGNPALSRFVRNEAYKDQD